MKQYYVTIRKRECYGTYVCANDELEAIEKARAEMELKNEPPRVEYDVQELLEEEIPF